MEYYLPQDGHIERLEGAQQDPLSQEQLDELRMLVEEDPDDPKIDDVFKVFTQ